MQAHEPRAKATSKNNDAFDTLRPLFTAVHCRLSRAFFLCPLFVGYGIAGSRAANRIPHIVPFLAFGSSRFPTTRCKGRLSSNFIRLPLYFRLKNAVKMANTIILRCDPEKRKLLLQVAKHLVRTLFGNSTSDQAYLRIK
jgi:hypothetical protein